MTRKNVIFLKGIVEIFMIKMTYNSDLRAVFNVLDIDRKCERRRMMVLQKEETKKNKKNK